MLAHGSWAEIFSDRLAALGPTTPGKAGGATIRPTMSQSLCSRVTRGPTYDGRRHEVPFCYRWVGGGFGESEVAAKGKDIRIGGGVSAIRQYLAASLIDEMHLAISSVLLGEGEHLVGELDLPKLG